ncbi:MAG: AbrB/MazE/SpoVT family DNA-binding domain-containing protein [Desulfohalobiaceae bacterium]|nr:AbrB/MazE/SpoVT family DNA-binding domain-containing protein [Desulfohalobiaceae bacterium]
MRTAKLFQNGNSQAVRLPMEYRFSKTEVKIYRKGRQVVLETLENSWDLLLESLDEFYDLPHCNLQSTRISLKSLD